MPYENLRLENAEFPIQIRKSCGAVQAILSVLPGLVIVAALELQAGLLVLLLRQVPPGMCAADVGQSRQQNEGAA